MNGRMRLAVTGKPVMHSRSPQIFNRIFEKMSVDGFYSRIAADTVEEAEKCAEIISLTGINVTAPFKNNAYSVSDNKSRTADFLAASNTLCFAGRCITADNTDPVGVSGAVSRRFPQAAGLKAVVIGAGGAGRAACYALSSMGFNTVMVNRTVENAYKSIQGIRNCTAESLENINSAVKDASLVIHTLPVADIFFNPELLLKDAVLFDANYKYSPLKKPAEEMGLRYIDGREWLLGQAEAAYSIFKRNAPCLKNMPESGKAADLNNDAADNGMVCPDSCCDGLIEEADEIFSSSPCFSSISLIGFMGSGKSATGRKLAELTGYEFVDTDAVIENRAGMSISEMFENKGEPYFRNMEREVLSEILSGGSRKIISCGGGVVGDSCIRNLLKEKSLPVWLLASPEVSLSRITDNSRPLLETSERYEKAVSLFKMRIDLYGSVSELIINSETRNAGKTAGRIYEEISEFI